MRSWGPSRRRTRHACSCRSARTGPHGDATRAGAADARAGPAAGSGTRQCRCCAAATVLSPGTPPETGRRRCRRARKKAARGESRGGPFWAPRLRSALRWLRSAPPPRKPEPGPSLEGRCEFFELRFTNSVSNSTCLVSASSFAVSSALLAVSSASAAPPSPPVPSFASSPTATRSLDHDRIGPSIRLEAKNAGGPERLCSA